MNLLENDNLAALTATFCDERRQAINGRKDLENIWKAARNQYKGIDEANTRGTLYEKGESLNSSITPMQSKADKDRSTVLLNITRPYTNAGTARVADILLPTGKMPWELRATPVSDLQTVMGVLKDYPEVLMQLPNILPDVTRKMQNPESAKAAMEVASQIIKDWLKESDWAGVVRKQLIEAGLVGTGVLKGPFPRERVVSMDVQKIIDILPFIVDSITQELLTKQLETMLRYTPRIECIKVENCYPDPDCGTDIQNGKFFFEKIPEVTKRQLQDMLKDPNYFPGPIKLALEEGPKDELTGNKGSSKKPYCLWIRTGAVEWKQDGEERSLGFGVVTMLNDRIIKYSQFPLESQSFPYRMLCWEPRDNSWAGIGIPEQMETPQRGLTASVRALMDNMGYSVGPQVLELDGIIEPIEGEDHNLRPYKRWKVKSGLPGVDAMSEAKNAMAFLEFPNYLNEIMPVIQFWLKMAEDTTGLSLLLQGQAVTDAVGVSQQLMNNSTTNLRLIVKEWDDKVCKPLLTDFYEWVQLYGPEDAQGDAVIEPLGSTTLIVKELQQQALLQIGQQVVQPIYGISPKKWMQTYLEGFQIDFENLALTDEERQQLEQAAQQPDPKVIVAQIEAEMEKYKADIKAQIESVKTALDAQYKQLSLAQAQAEAQVKSDTALVQKGLDVEQRLKSDKIKAEQPVGKMSSAEGTDDMQESASAEDMPNPVDVKSALSMLGLE